MVRKHLGKGLKALIPDEPALDSAAADGEKFIEVDIDKVKPSAYQAREEYIPERMEELKNSIREKGIIQPITVRPVDNGYELIAGERRFRAAREIGIKKIPAYILFIDDKEDLLELSIIENVQRENLNPVELAKGYKRLIDECSLTQEEVAAKVSVDRTTVTNLIRLLALPKEVKESLKKGEISMGHARALLSVKGSGKQIQYLEKIRSKQMSVRELEALIYKTRQKREKKESRIPAQKLWVKEYENKIRGILGTKVAIVEKGNKGYVKIEFYSETDLERIIEFIDSTEKKY